MNKIILIKIKINNKTVKIKNYEIKIKYTYY